MGIETSQKPPQTSKFRWGELDEDEGDDLDFLLPPPRMIGPDEKGIKKLIQYQFNEDGNKVKITTTSRTRKLVKPRISERPIEGHSRPKFGDALHEDVDSRLTMVSTENIYFERPKAPGDPLAQLGKGGAVLMICRTCGKKGDHWTANCAFKHLATQPEGFINQPAAPETAASASSPTRGTYVPPGLRAGAERTRQEMKRRNDENSVRVTSLSEDTREPDLLELFRPFGAVSRVYVAVDQKTGLSRGFGFVNYVNKEDAERAICTLNGYGYDNLILGVEWATPRAN